MFGLLSRLFGDRGGDVHSSESNGVKLIVGLGNPGAEYERTRHNAGYMVVDHLVSRCAPGETVKARFKSLAVECRLPEPDEKDALPTLAAGGERCLLIKPTTYMNLSGQAVAEAIRFYKLDAERDLLVVVDDVALPCGTIRLRGKGGSGGHNGLANIQQLLGTQNYARLRIGIDPPGRIPQKDYVLGKFSPDQKTAMDRVVPTAAAVCAFWAHNGGIATMNRYNAGDEPKKKAAKEVPDRPDDAGDTPEEREASGLSGPPADTEQRRREAS